MKSNFKRNIQIGFGLSLLVLILSSAASFVSIRALLNSSKLVNHTNQVIQGLDEIMAIMRDAETGQRGFLLSGDEKFLQQYNGVTEKAMSAWTNVKILTSDNPAQQKNCEHLKALLDRRIFFMQRLVDMRKAEEVINITFLEEGKNMMDELRVHTSAMKATEKNLLADRTAAMNRFASYTPILIIIAAILSLLITIFFYIKVSNDFSEKTKLQKDLEAKDLEIRNRIAIIQDIADKISAGDYKIRVNDTEKDDLGSLSFALNKMAESLDLSFSQLHHKEWLQGGIAKLNETMVGEKTIDQLTNDIIQFIAEFTNSQVAAFYLVEGDEQLILAGSFAIDNQAKRRIINRGEGVVGQCH